MDRQAFEPIAKLSGAGIFGPAGGTEEDIASEKLVN